MVHLDTTILHGAMEYSEGGGIIPGFLVLVSVDFKARLRQYAVCDNRPLLGGHTTSSQLSGTVNNVLIPPLSIALQSVLTGVFMGGLWCGVPGRSLYFNIIED